MDHHCVPNFDMDGDYTIPPCSTTRLNKMSYLMAEEDDFMELLWQNGQVVVQTQRSGRKPLEMEATTAVVISNGEQSSAAAGEIRSAAAQQQQQHLFMQEDEMASWLHSPLDDTSFDRDLYADLIHPTMSTPAPPQEVRTTELEITPPPPPPPVPAVVAPQRPVPPASPRFQNFMHFARLAKATTTVMVESAPSNSSKAVVDSNETPMVGPRRSRVLIPPKLRCGSMIRNEAAGTSITAKELTATTCELTVTSSPGGSGASISASAEAQEHKQPHATAEDRKRKGREADDNEGHSMDLEFESGETKKQAHGSTSTKRSRAAEVHNLSERRRRDRINERMKALQELIPRCNKSDKASMLEEAIEYLKALQMQVQMMSMGCTMVPMLYPGVQQYMPTMGMGMGMGMGMRMDMGMNRPIVPYPPLLPGSTIPNPATAAHMGPRFPMPAFHIPPVPIPDPSTTQACNTSDPMINTHVSHNPSLPQPPNFVDPSQQYHSLHQGHVPLPLNQVIVQPGTEKPGTSREVGNPENHPSGGG